MTRTFTTSRPSSDAGPGLSRQHLHPLRSRWARRRLSHVAVLTLGATLALASAADAAVTANVAANQLNVQGDAANDVILLRLLAGDATQVEVLDNGVVIGTFARGTFATISVDGGAGTDAITISDVNGVFTDTELTTLAGGDNNDTITGGGGPETLLGGNGNDVLLGGAGFDSLQGGDGNDTMTGGPGGPGFEPHLGGAGNDTMVWNPGDGNDLNEGGADIDTTIFNGSAGDEIMAATPNGTRVTFTRNLGNIIMDIGTTENLVVNALGGADTVTGAIGLAPLIAMTFDGGDGNDILTGGDGIDILRGGPGNDTITGARGNDPHVGGPGDDLMIWNPGDGNDINDGEDGTDTLRFNGAAGAEIMAAVANGARVTFTRNLGNIVMDVGTTERIEVNGLAGDDAFTVGAGLATLTTVIIDGGAGLDTFDVPASSLVSLVGGTENDTLTFNAENQPVSVQPAAIVVAGVARASFTQIETVTVVNAPTGAPSLTITSPTADPATTSTAALITLAGVAADTGGIQSIAWTNDRGGSGAAVGTTSWTASDIPLQLGANVITVTATDAAGNTASDALTVTVGAFSYFLAEGGTGAFFDLDVLVANPTNAPAPIVANFLKDDGTTVAQNFMVGALSRLTINVDAIPGLEAVGGVSTVITSTNSIPLVVERTMFWDSNYYGSHGGTAVDGPNTRWLFAEGSEGFFNTFVLLANANPAAVTATLTFLREGSTPVTRIVQVPPTSRVTVVAGEIPEIVNTSFSIVVDATAPIIAERAMYFGTNRFLDGGHESAGVSAGATSWFLAEGATGPFFETFVLVGNPNPTPANVTLTFLTSTGGTVTRHSSSRATPADGEHRDAGSEPGQRRRIDDGDIRPAGRGRARDVLAGAAVGVERNAQQLRHPYRGHQVGPG